MERYDKRIAVTTNSFSKNSTLVEELGNSFPNYTLSRDPLSREELFKRFEYANGAIIGLDTINEELLKNSPKLKVISKFGVGVDNVDFDACKKYGVAVHYTPGINKRSVSELAIGFMLGLMRNYYPSSMRLKGGEWKKDGGQNLSEKKIGIIGVGNVGKDLVKLLEPFNCKIYVNDIRDDSDQINFYNLNNLVSATKEEIYKNADIITIHTPLNPETNNLITAKELSVMKPSSFLINTARGKIVNNDNLYDALVQEKIAGAALDVYSEEPPTNKELIALENLICTPHIGGNSNEAVLAMGRSAIDGLTKYFGK